MTTTTEAEVEEAMHEALAAGIETVEGVHAFIVDRILEQRRRSEDKADHAALPLPN